MFYKTIRFLCAGLLLIGSFAANAQQGACPPPEKPCAGSCYNLQHAVCYSGLNPADYPTGAIICAKDERPCGGACYNTTYGNKKCHTDLPRNLYPRGSIACNGDEVPCRGGCAKASQCK